MGGYALARQPGEITLIQLIEAVEGPVRLTRCCAVDAESNGQKCAREGLCHIRESVHKLHAGLRLFLNQVTLSDLVSNRVALNVQFMEPAEQAPCEQLLNA